MKSLVTTRTVSVGPMGVSGPPGPSGAFAIPVTTGVVPLQLKDRANPDTWGNRPVAIAVSHTGLNPLSRACSNCAPVSVSSTVRLPNGNTADTSPQVISPGCSPAAGGANTRSARRPPELVNAASTAGYLARIASATRSPICDSLNRVGSCLLYTSDAAD